MTGKSIRFLSLLLALVLVLPGCGATPAPEATTIPTEAPTEPTSPPDGNPDDVTCQGSYTAQDIAAGTVVATMDGAELTNEQLQVYYWLEVAAFRQEHPDDGPDFSRDLDTQLVPVSSRILTWQQFFLEKALNAWHAQQALVRLGEEEGVPTEEEYKPDLEKRQEYMTGMPATKYLYGWNDSYTPNRLHQDYLDAIPDTLEALASENGFGSAGEMAAAMAGTGSQALTHYATLANRAYMYFTEMGYHHEPTDEDIRAYFEAHQDTLVTGGEKTVNLRHILLLPENAEIGPDGTVTASEEDWDRCRVKATSLVDQWQTRVRKTRYSQFATADVAEARFSEFAKNNSADPGSSINGGLYVSVAQGQLIPELDAWCFDPARQHGDYEVIRSGCGYHIVYFSRTNEDWYIAAKAALARDYYSDLVDRAMETYPAKTDYSAIRLGQVEFNGSFITPSHLLYPDVAHERFPDMPLYLQQDYPDAPYGDYKLSSHGCGITTLAMVASYYTDDELTPVELAANYGYYCGVRGTEIVIFDDTPAEMGFHLQKRTYSWDEMDRALENGQVVISLQWAGYWTRGGHYLAMIDLTEDGKYVVRDSNLINYYRIPAHVNDCHTRGSIAEVGQYYWIYEKKVTTIPACVRCGLEGDASAPERLFHSGYTCQKCLTATERRDNFLTGLAG